MQYNISLQDTHTHSDTHIGCVQPITNTDSRRQDIAPSVSLALKYTWSTWTLCQCWNKLWNNLSQRKVDCGGPRSVTIHSHTVANSFFKFEPQYEMQQVDQHCSMLIWAKQGNSCSLCMDFKQNKNKEKYFCKGKETTWTVFLSPAFWCDKISFLTLPFSVFYQMWSIARWRSPAVHRWDIYRTLYSPGGNTAISEHNRTGEIRNTPLPSNKANWETARHRCVYQLCVSVYVSEVNQVYQSMWPLLKTHFLSFVILTNE